MNASKRPRLLRRNWVVDKQYQNQFAIALVGFQINIGLLYLGVIQFRIHQLVGSAGTVGELTEMNWWTALLPWTVAISLVLGGIVWMVGLFFSNSIVGPIPRLQNALKAMAAGDYSQRLNFRPGDALEELAQDVNALAEKLSAETDGSSADSVQFEQSHDDVDEHVDAESLHV